MRRLSPVHLPLVLVYCHYEKVPETINLERRFILIFSFVDFCPQLIGPVGWGYGEAMPYVESTQQKKLFTS